MDLREGDPSSVTTTSTLVGHVGTQIYGGIPIFPEIWVRGVPNFTGYPYFRDIVEVMAGAASGKCRLELYRDPSCLIGEAPESRKEVSRVAYSRSSTV